MHLQALAVVPWKEILTSAPAIVSSARFLYERLRQRSGDGEPQSSADVSPDVASLGAELDAMRTRLQALESDQARQADLIAQMATQEEALSRGLQAVSSRVTVLLWVSVAALVAALVAVALALVL